MSYRIGNCIGCGVQTWITDAFGKPTNPISHAREGYIVFDHPVGENIEGEMQFVKSRLRIPLCSGCATSPNIESLKNWFDALVAAQVVPNLIQYQDAEIIGYEPHEKIWKELGVKPSLVQDWAMPSHLLSEEVH